MDGPAQASPSPVLPMSDIAQVGNSLLVDTSVQLLSDLVRGLECLSSEQYANSIEGAKSSIGKHVRHIIEFYLEYIRYIESASSEPLCYDSRKRDLILETSFSEAVEKIDYIGQHLIAAPLIDKDIQLSAIVQPSLPPQLLNSTLQRELIYLFDHTIHHMALIKMLAEIWCVDLPRSFGLAPSTISHENS